jgi:hypothetical protein
MHLRNSLSYFSFKRWNPLLATLVSTCSAPPRRDHVRHGVHLLQVRLLRRRVRPLTQVADVQVQADPPPHPLTHADVLDGQGVGAQVEIESKT